MIFWMVDGGYGFPSSQHALTTKQDNLPSRELSALRFFAGRSIQPHESHLVQKGSPGQKGLSHIHSMWLCQATNQLMTGFFGDTEYSLGLCPWVYSISPHKPVVNLYIYSTLAATRNYLKQYDSTLRRYHTALGCSL